MLTLARGLAAAAVFTAAAVGSATPAWADDPLDGTFAYTEPGALSSTWTLFSTCVKACNASSPDCTRPHYDLGVGCTMHVASSMPAQSTRDERNATYSGNARLVNGLWTLSAYKPDGMLCPDGSTAPSLENYAFDDVTLTGTRTVTYGEVCGMQPGLTKHPFSLAFVAPPSDPVVRYPEFCTQFAICS
jgi:hypothetical protein